MASPDIALVRGLNFQMVCQNRVRMNSDVDRTLVKRDSRRDFIFPSYETDPVLRETVMRCLVRDPDQRPTIKEMMQMLKEPKPIKLNQKLDGNKFLTVTQEDLDSLQDLKKPEKVAMASQANKNQRKNLSQPQKTSTSKKEVKSAQTATNPKEDLKSSKAKHKTVDKEEL